MKGVLEAVRVKGADRRVPAQARMIAGWRPSDRCRRLDRSGARRYPGQHPAGVWVSVRPLRDPPHCRCGRRAAAVAARAGARLDHDRGHVGPGVEAGRDAERVRVVARLVALGVPQASLDSFPEEFRQGMPARASILGDTGPNAPSTWEFGNDPDRTHVFFALYGRTAEARERLLAIAARRSWRQVGAAVEVTHQLDAQMLGESARAFRLHGRHRSAGDRRQRRRGISGRRHARRRARCRRTATWAPLKAGEFVLGWPGETGFPPPAPQPDVLAKNGSFLVYRKLRQDVAAFRAFLREQSSVCGAPTRARSGSSGSRRSWWDAGGAAVR